MMIHFFFFFFSSRRRHTRSKRDWSSDVCSSDLTRDNLAKKSAPDFFARLSLVLLSSELMESGKVIRSEERRVGKECRSWRATSQEKNKIYSITNIKSR